MTTLAADTDALARMGRALSTAGVELADLDDPTADAGRVVLAATHPPRGRTGRLAAGIHATPAANGVVFASTARYWTFVHYGAPRRHLRARPFFTEALTASRDDVLAVYARHAATTLGRNLP